MTHRLVARLLTGVLLVVAALSCSSRALARDPDDPQILAIVIGVSRYADNQNLDLTVANARTVADRIGRTFAKAKVLLLTSEEADPAMVPTYDRLRDILQKEIPRLPRFSLVLVYFAGHGVRIGDPAVVGQTDLGLVLDGGRPSSDNPDLPNTLLYTEMLLGLKRMRMGNFVVFLDCCHSGNEDSPATVVDRLEFQLLSIRGIVFSAALRSQKTYQDVFTIALDKYWSESAARRCTRPSGMINRIGDLVRDIMRERAGVDIHPSALWPQIILGAQTQICLGAMGKPSAFLFIIPPRGKDPVFFQVDGGEEESFRPSDDAVDPEAKFYIRQVERQSTPLTCRAGTNFERSLVLTADELVSEIVWVDFNRPPGQEVGKPDVPMAAVRVASDVSYELGARDKSACDLEMEVLTRSLSLPDVEAVRFAERRIAARQYDDWRWQGLAGQRGPGLGAEHRQPEELLQTVALLNALGRETEAVRLATRALLLDDAPVPHPALPKSLVRTHEYVSLKLAGDTAGAHTALNMLMTDSSLTKGQLKFIETVGELSEPELRASVMSLPVESRTWKLVR